jgi:hypothetical protein
LAIKKRRNDFYVARDDITSTSGHFERHPKRQSRKVIGNITENINTWFGEKLNK